MKNRYFIIPLLLSLAASFEASAQGAPSINDQCRTGSEFAWKPDPHTGKIYRHFCYSGKVHTPEDPTSVSCERLSEEIEEFKKDITLLEEEIKKSRKDGTDVHFWDADMDPDDAENRTLPSIRKSLETAEKIRDIIIADPQNRYRCLGIS